ncbi:MULTISPECIES: hypothetical protein [unclassified Niallia]|uniref:hypothetical protein n=1 Tax=unclassified Niallia TaxID=2837522 RepID=UPI001EDC86D2|nr:hypothetical protein [Niallia sp. Man26]UPO90266.1 hypothetical protein L8T27_019515 [Niallia sp. Man26]
MIQIELICHELKRLMDDYYKCEDPAIKQQIHHDIKLLSEGLFLSDLPEVLLKTIK